MDRRLQGSGSGGLDYKARSRFIERVVGSGAEPLWRGYPVRPSRRRTRVKVVAGHKKPAPAFSLYSKVAFNSSLTPLLTRGAPA